MSKEFKIDPELKTFATEAQGQVIDAINEHGGFRKAARVLGVHHTVLMRKIDTVKRNAAVRGYAPENDWTRAVPQTHVAKGVSTYYNKDGEPTGQWVKADLRQEAYNELVKGAIAAFLESAPQLDVPDAPLDPQDDIIPWIQIGDAHIGMLAHAAEVGENFDLKIAERELCCGIGTLIDELPQCKRIVINDLGDGTHYENIAAVTAASGHPLDADGRFPKMVRVYIRALRFIVEKALTKSEHVDVILNRGNHSEVNDVWAAELLRAVYGHTGRVHVLDNDSVFIPYRMGKTLVMVHHGHKCPPQRLAGVMISDFSKDFGETDFHYIDQGHVHHNFVVKEHPSVVLESWNHLAANDRWAHDSGYRSRKCITVVYRSKTYGDVGRRVLPIEAIRDKLGLSGKLGKQVFTV